MSNIPGLNQLFKKVRIEYLRKNAPSIRRTKLKGYTLDVNLKTGKIVVSPKITVLYE
jgi:hypothetical protein